MTRAHIRVPTLPNFVTVTVGTTQSSAEVKISVADLDDEDIDILGAKWTEAMKAHAKGKRESVLRSPRSIAPADFHEETVGDRRTAPQVWEESATLLRKCVAIYTRVRHGRSRDPHEHLGRPGPFFTLRTGDRRRVSRHGAPRDCVWMGGLGARGIAHGVTAMLSNSATAQVAQLVEQGTEKAFRSAKLDPEEIVRRFRSHVDISGGPAACHPWRLSTDRDGYGAFSVSNAVKIGAHRFALMLKLGRGLAPWEVARHANTCTTRACCNDAHLSEGTQADNIRDRDEAGRVTRGEQHWRRKLTATLVMEARSRAAAGERVSAIARSFSVSRKCIEHVVAGRNWKHVPQAVAS